MSTPRGRHIILTLGRSGSNTLVDMLNQHPAVLNYGEVLGDWTKLRKLTRRLGLFRGDDMAYLDAVLGGPRMLRAANGFRNWSKRIKGQGAQAKRLADIRTVGIKEFSLNMAACGAEGILHRAPLPRVIGLTRANVLARMVSNEMLQATGVVLVHGEDGEDGEDAKAPARKLNLTPGDVLDRLEKIETETAALETLLDGIAPDRVIRLDYEDLYSDPARTVDTVRRVYGFLDLPDFTPAIRMGKILKSDPIDAFENAPEIRAAISASRFACWLDG